MCIAIYKPKGASLTKKTLWNCWMSNQDGAGFMYAEGGTLHVEKGFFKFKPFWKAVRPHLFENDKDVVLHFRIATSGKVDEENCHPHLIHPNLAYVHNGIISDLNDDKNVCDTIRFANILKSLPPDFVTSPALLSLIEMAVGSSRMVFMNGDGIVGFINHASGIESGGIWYSNGGFRGGRVSSTSLARSYAYSGGYYGGAEYRDAWLEDGWAVRRTPTGKVYTPIANEAKEKLKADAVARATALDKMEARAEALLDEGDYPHYAMFDTYQRFDEQLEDDRPIDPESGMTYGMIEDEYGYTEYDYQVMAEEDIEWWQKHPDRLLLSAHMAILELDPKDRRSRLDYQEWLDLWEPDWTSQHEHVNCPKKEEAIIQTTTTKEELKQQMSEAIQEVVNLVAGRLAAPLALTPLEQHIQDRLDGD